MKWYFTLSFLLCSSSAASKAKEELSGEEISFMKGFIVKTSPRNGQQNGFGNFSGTKRKLLQHEDFRMIFKSPLINQVIEPLQSDLPHQSALQSDPLHHYALQSDPHQSALQSDYKLSLPTLLNSLSPKYLPRNISETSRISSAVNSVTSDSLSSCCMSRVSVGSGASSAPRSYFNQFNGSRIFTGLSSAILSGQDMDDRVRYASFTLTEGSGAVGSMQDDEVSVSDTEFFETLCNFIDSSEPGLVHAEGQVFQPFSSGITGELKSAALCEDSLTPKIRSKPFSVSEFFVPAELSSQFPSCASFDFSESPSSYIDDFPVVAPSEDLASATFPAAAATSPFPSHFMSEIDKEYLPWVPFSPDRPLTPVEDSTLESLFGLKPMSSDAEIVEIPETEANITFFPHNFKPFLYYGDIAYETEKMAHITASTKDIIEQGFQEIDTKRSNELSTRYRGTSSKSRHKVALQYANSPVNAELIESKWIFDILADGVVNFAQESAEEWTLNRSRKFISALLPSLLHSPHVEENLTDFLNEFLYKKVIPNALKQILTPENRISCSRELTDLAKDMIKNLVPPSIFESFIEKTQMTLIRDDAGSLYETLFNTMKKFKLSKPYESREIEQPVLPRKGDPKYKSIRIRARKQEAFDQDMVAYHAAMKQYEEAVNRERVQKRYQSDLRRQSINQKGRSFEFLKILINYMADPIMSSTSRWTSPELLHVNNAELEADSTEFQMTSDLSEEYSSKDLYHRLTGPGAHQNQDFFDALYFSKVLRACLMLNHPQVFVKEHLIPFFTKNQFPLADSPIGLRFLKTLDKFIQLTRLNSVSNVHPSFINYRRYLLAYLCQSAVGFMGIEPSKVQSRAVSLNLLSLFESIHLYQILPSPLSMLDRMSLFETLIATKETSFQFPIIFVTYNPLSYQAIAKVIEKIFSDRRTISTGKLNAYYEIFAMVRNVDLLSIYDRKIFQFISDTSPEFSPLMAQTHFTQGLFNPSEVAYNWSMSRRLKNFSTIETHLNYPYGAFAVRMLLARRFGISFDSSKFNAQFAENFTWLECIGFANFFLDKEAKYLVDKTSSKTLNHQYQLFRVSDFQANYHKHRALPTDEPTHHINSLITAGFYQLSQLDRNRLLAQDPQLFQTLFERYSIGLKSVLPAKLMEISKPSSLAILIFFLNDQNRPESFVPSEYPELA